MRIETKKYLNPSGESISAHVGQGGIEKSQEIKASNAGVRRKKINRSNFGTGNFYGLCSRLCLFRRCQPSPDWS